MNAAELIKKLEELDPRTDIFEVRADYDYGYISFHPLESVDGWGQVTFGRSTETRDMED